MTADIINLKRVRKAKAHVAKADSAAVNRAAFGRTKAERAIAEAEAARANQLLDGAKLSFPLPVRERMAPMRVHPHRGQVRGLQQIQRAELEQSPSSAPSGAPSPVPGEGNSDDDVDPGNVS